MLNLLAAMVCFVGSHFLLSSTALRARLVAWLGERLFLGLYSLAAIWLLIWAGFAYGAAPYVELWGHLPGLYALPLLTMPLAAFLLVAGSTTRNPTAVGQSPAMSGTKPEGIATITRHPILWAIGIWALAHLAANGDIASLILFGGLAFLALGGTLAIDAKRRRAWGERWGAFEAATSNLPFAAIAKGRTRLKLGEIGWWRILLAAVLFVVLLWLHPLVIGASPVPAG
jgi:uncharacterized membrane protein